ncbi:OsmC family protein [Streptomyces sp. NPDC051018]|uniref:OsmC family protein n=1 Tax=Streptomyces sp. NPDC051018 TaxID=3365639 RepID=UPI0037B341C1
MRNGMNIAGVSEVVHEVQAEPHEAVYRYGAAAEWHTGRGIRARNEPAVLGTVKSPRRFELAVAEENDPGRGGGPTPVRLALTALGACALTTFIGGASARGVTLESLRLALGAEQVRDGTSGRITDLTYTLTVRADTGGVDLAEVLAGVEERSPNHRTLVDPQPLTLVLDGAGEPVPAPTAPAAGRGLPVSATVTWSYSVQLVATTDGDPAELRVDQPKQLAGVDWGPNPQEYLLMALASCVLGRVAELSARPGRPPHPWRVRATGQVDIRGLFDIGDDPTVPVHRLTLEVTPLDAATARAEDWRDTVREAVRRSPVAALLTAGHPVKVELDAGAEAAHG